MRRKKNGAGRVLLSILLVVFALAILGTIGYLAVSLTRKNKQKEAQQLQQMAEQQKPDSEGENTGAGQTDAGDSAEALEQADAGSEGADPEQTDAGSDGENPEQTDIGNEEASGQMTNDGPVQVGDQVFTAGFTAAADAETIRITEDTDVMSKHALLIDLSNDRIAVQKDMEGRIYPASMTKILTILVAAEHMNDPEELYTIPEESVTYCLRNGCSAAGFVTNETVPVKDLFYGTILPSGAEAAVSLAMYTAGSHEAFVELMNQKLEELGLNETAHMTNCVGVYDDAHYCTLTDMAMILKAAMENDFCREVLKTHVYTTAQTEQNPEGLILSNWFLRRIEDKDSGGLVVGAKTGYVTQSGDCAASYFVSNSGTPYICVTVDAHSEWRCIYDHVAMYKLYAF